MTITEEFVADGYQHTFCIKRYRKPHSISVAFDGRDVPSKWYIYDDTGGSVSFITPSRDPNPPTNKTHIEVEIKFSPEVLQFGKYKGKNIKQIDLDYLCWLTMSTKDFKLREVCFSELKRRDYILKNLEDEWMRLTDLGVIDESTGYRNWDRIKELERFNYQAGDANYPRLHLVRRVDKGKKLEAREFTNRLRSEAGISVIEEKKPVRKSKPIVKKLGKRKLL